MTRHLLSLLFATIVAFSAAGCDNEGCASDCLADCLSDCAGDCGGCGDCGDCSDCGCGIGPIPNGFPSGQDERGDLRLPNATQIRLTPQGLDFIEEQATDLIAAAVPGGLNQSIPSGIQGGGAAGLNFNIMLCAEQVLDFEIPETGVDGADCLDFGVTCLNNTGGNTVTRRFTAPEDGRALLGVDSPFGTTCRTFFEAFDVTNPASPQRVCGIERYVAPNSKGCDFAVGRGREYEVRVTRSRCSLQSGFAKVFTTPAGGCNINVELGDETAPMELVPDGNFIDARVPVFVSSVNGAGERYAFPMVVWEDVFNIGTGFDACTLDFTTRRAAPASIPMSVEAGIGASSSRPGFGELAIGDFSIDTGSIQTDDISSNCTAFGLSLGQLGGLVQTFVGDPANIVTGAIAQVKDDLARLCQPALQNPFTGEFDLCPGGSVARPNGQSSSGATVYSCFPYTDTNGDGLYTEGEAVGGTCVSQLLGAEFRVDMGDLLSSISPGLRAAVDVLFAVQDNAHAASDGYTVSAFGGFDNLAPTASCVPALTAEQAAELGLASPPNDIDVVSAFEGASDTHHLQAGLSERVMNWGAYQLWQSGALCLQVTTRLDQLLSTGLFSVLIRSLKDLAFPNDGAALGIALRPALPPALTLGAGTEEDPFLTLSLPQLSLDFYVWSTERYVRFMTFTSDVRAMVNLPIADGQLTPEIVGVTLDNSEVTNNELIREDPATVALAVENVVPLALGMAAGALPQVSINELLAGADLPVGVALGDDAIRLVESDGERFLGAFIDLAAPSAGGLVQRADTTLELVDVDVPDEAYLSIDSFGVGASPTVEIAMGAQGPAGVEFEYSYRVDRHAWSSWSRSPYALLDADTFVLQGRHEIQARARAVGVVGSQDLTPARAEFLIDVQAPFVEAIATNEGNILRAGDAVSDASHLDYRYRASGDAQWSEWSPLGVPEQTLTEVEGAAEFEVRDEAGNVGRSAEALRGLPPPSDGGGCGDCSGSSGSPSRPLNALAWLAMMWVFFRRRGRQGEV